MNDELTLRDYFAAAALTGIIASPACSKANPSWQNVAAKAYAQADAMLAERAKQPVNPQPKENHDSNS